MKNRPFPVVEVCMHRRPLHPNNAPQDQDTYGISARQRKDGPTKKRRADKEKTGRLYRKDRPTCPTRAPRGVYSPPSFCPPQLFSSRTGALLRNRTLTRPPGLR